MIHFNFWTASMCFNLKCKKNVESKPYNLSPLHNNESSHFTITSLPLKSCCIQSPAGDIRTQTRQFQNNVAIDGIWWTRSLDSDVVAKHPQQKPKSN